MLKQYSRGAKLLITHKDIPNLHFQGEEEGETLEVNVVNDQDPEVSTPGEGGDEHSTPSSVQNKIDTQKQAGEAEGDEYSTPSSTKDSTDVRTIPVVDDTNQEQADGGESDEHSTPSTEPKDIREVRNNQQ